MRLPRVRFTVWQAMVAVVALAILMATGRAGWHSYYCWRMAEAHAWWAERGLLRCGLERPTAAEQLVYDRYNRILKDYHARLERKYRRAAWRLWEPVLPDPPYPSM
jgi:hypothetical protein